jgi:hypothetical protein
LPIVKCFTYGTARATEAVNVANCVRCSSVSGVVRLPGCEMTRTTVIRLTLAAKTAFRSATRSVAVSSV